MGFESSYNSPKEAFAIFRQSVEIHEWTQGVSSKVMIPWSQNDALKELINVLDWGYWWMFVRGNLGPTVFFRVKFRQRILELRPLQRLFFFVRKNRQWSRPCFFCCEFWLNFRPEKYDFDLGQGFSMGKMAQISQISISKNFKSSESYDNFQKVVKNIEGFWFFLLSYLFCSQIWLNHLMDDCHFSYITNLQKKPYCCPLWFNDV